MNSITRHSVVFAVMMFCVGMSVFGHNVLAGDAPVRLSVTSIGGDTISVTMTNESHQPVEVLRWGTAFETVMSHDLFNIRSAENPLQDRLVYKGRSAKRGVPLAENFIYLRPGESVQKYLNLSTYYSVNKEGQYALIYDGPIVFKSPIKSTLNFSSRQIKSSEKNGLDTPHAHASHVQSDSITIELNVSPATRAARAPAYFSCSAGQQSELVTALQAAEEITNVARDGLASLQGDAKVNSPRYRNWFGGYTADRFNTVLDTFNKAAAVLADEQIEFDCRCDEAGLYAYVFPSDPYRIYPCPNFWSASLTGTDSRAGTILHELTHFPAIKGTDDYEYGPVAVARLAIENPQQAVDNADSYEYFAENTPEIAIENQVVFTDMTIGVGEVSELGVGESSFYKIAGADYLELTSTEGDADLYVFETAANIVEQCRSISSSGYDRCDIDRTKTAFVEVRGYVASQYALIARVNSTTQPEPEPDPDPDPDPEPVVTVAGGDDQGGGSVGLSLLCLFGSRRIRLFVARAGSRQK